MPFVAYMKILDLALSGAEKTLRMLSALFTIGQRDVQMTPEQRQQYIDKKKAFYASAAMQTDEDLGLGNPRPG